MWILEQAGNSCLFLFCAEELIDDFYFENIKAQVIFELIEKKAKIKLYLVFVRFLSIHLITLKFVLEYALDKKKEYYSGEGKGDCKRGNHLLLFIIYMLNYLKKGVLCIYDDLEGGHLMQKSTQALMKKIGIKELFEVPRGKLQGSTVLATNGKENLTVSQLLKSVVYLIEFIKNHFDVDEYRYSVTLIYFESIQLVLNNRRVN